MSGFKVAFKVDARPGIQFDRLPEQSRPLLDKFYRQHRSPMRLPAQGHAWVAKDTQILAALCLTPVRHGHWLTGLFVAPSQRGQGLAGQLLAHALTSCQGPVWLFCHPQLLDFYQRQGFQPAGSLPAELAERLARYQRHKALIALIHDGVSRLPETPAPETAPR